MSSSSHPPDVLPERDELDAHDLSLSPYHAARTSIVDNMLLSLDQFEQSGTHTRMDHYHLYRSVLEANPYTPSTRPYRYRDDNFSADSRNNFKVGKDDGAAAADAADAASAEAPQVHRAGKSRRRTDSSANGEPRPSTMDDCNSDGEDHNTGSLRGRSRTRALRKNSRSGPSSNVDFGNVSNWKSKKNRRSASFDFGALRLPDTVSKQPKSVEDMGSYAGSDAAPPPSVSAGPRKRYSALLRSDTGDGTVSHSLAQQLSKTSVSPAVRGNSVRSPWPKKADLVVEARDAPYPRDVPPHVPSSSQEEAAFSSISSADKSAPRPAAAPPPLPVASAKERPGFFRRVFASARSVTTAQPQSPVAETSPTPQRPYDKSGTIRPPPPPPDTLPSGKTQRAHVVNKKSSFFRRRKKSVAEPAQPPFVHPLDTSPNNPSADEQANSPVSSLRQVMAPFIGESAFVSSKDGGADPETTASNDLKEHGQAPNPQKKHRRSISSTDVTSKPRYSLYPAPTPRESEYPNGSKAQTLVGAGPVRQQTTSLPNVFESIDSAVPADPNNAVAERGDIASVQKNGVRPHSEKDKGQDKDPLDPSAQRDRLAAEHRHKTNASQDALSADDEEQARKLFDSDGSKGCEQTASWLGTVDHSDIRKAYMRLFDWTSMDILSALRDMCTRLVLKGESQQVDRVLDAFAHRWCECNPLNGFRAAGMSVHQILYCCSSSDKLNQTLCTPFATLFFS